MKTTIEERKKEFVKLAWLQIGSELTEDFLDYWTEPNPKLTKMRFEAEKFFSFTRRWSTWKRNAIAFNPKKDFQSTAIKVMTQREIDFNKLQNGDNHNQLTQ